MVKAIIFLPSVLGKFVGKIWVGLAPVEKIKVILSFLFLYKKIFRGIFIFIYFKNFLFLKLFYENLSLIGKFFWPQSKSLDTCKFYKAKVV